MFLMDILTKACPSTFTDIGQPHPILRIPHLIYSLLQKLCWQLTHRCHREPFPACVAAQSFTGRQFELLSLYSSSKGKEIDSACHRSHNERESGAIANTWYESSAGVAGAKALVVEVATKVH